MGVEVASYISQLDKTLPQGASSPKEGDDHIRRIKEVLVQTFPNLDGPVSATAADMAAAVVGAASSGASPMVTTPAYGDMSQRAASTAFVANAVAGASAANSGPLVLLALINQGII